MKIATIKQIIKNIFLRLNFKIYKATIFSMITFVLIFPCVLFLSEEYAWENSYIENIQIFILLVMFLIAKQVKYTKQLFTWISFIVIILFLREINCGRIFFPNNSMGIPSFKKWNQILLYPYNYIPNCLFGLFMFYTIFYFFKSKAYLQLLTIVKKAKIDCWNIIFMMIGLIIGTLSEMLWHNEMLEETTETLFYVSFGVLIYLYGYNKDYKTEK